jgi:hydrogenase-4 component F
MILALVLIPTLAGLAAFFIRPDGPRRVLLMATAVVEAALTAAAWLARPSPVLGGWLALDALGLLFLGITCALFLAAAFYAVGYLRREEHDIVPDFEEGFLFANAPEAVFTGCALLFLAAMVLVTVSQHFGFLWVAVEATTLASAPLIYFHRHHRSLEAAWKYLLICSVGIALALLGTFFLAVSSAQAGGEAMPLLLGDLARHAREFHAPWLKAAFLLLLVGYGTKMGLAPLHTWLPDAHSESPSVVSALLSGAVLNCAFLAILRAFQVCAAAGLAEFAQGLLTGFGLLSMAVAAVFIFNQNDYKRMLAYSSVEHMGILALGVGLGGAATFGAMLHAINHSLTKAMLFLLAGNILAAYRTKISANVRGVGRVLPVTGALWIAGFLAITGSPPFGVFLSEFTILKGALEQHHGYIAAAYLALLAVIFTGMATPVLRMAQGEPASGPQGRAGREAWLSIVPALALGAAVLLLGLWIPQGLTDTLQEAARALSKGF